MPFASDVVVVRVTGSIGSTQTWSTGIAVEQPVNAAPTPAQLNTYCASLNSALGTAIGLIQGFISTDTVALAIKALYTPAGGSAVTEQGSTAVSHAGTGTVGTSARDCLVASLETGISGRSFRGRSYLPLTAAAGYSGVTHQVASSVAAAYSGAWAGFLTAINSAAMAWASGSAKAVIASKTRSLLTPITVVLVNSLPDTQRRREDKLAPLFAATTNV